MGIISRATKALKGEPQAVTDSRQRWLDAVKARDDLKAELAAARARMTKTQAGDYERTAEDKVKVAVLAAKLARQEKATWLVGHDLDAEITAGAIASGDQDAIDSDLLRVSRDVRNLLNERDRANATMIDVAAHAFDDADARDKLAQAAALRSFIGEAEALAMARLEFANAARVRIRARRRAEGLPMPEAFPSKPVLPSAVGWLAAVDQCLASPPSAIDFDDRIRRAEGEERKERSEQEKAREVAAAKAEAVRAQAEADAARNEGRRLAERKERERTTLSAQKYAAELERLAEAHRARTRL